LETFRVDQTVGERLDLFLTARLPEFSRSRLQGLIKEGFVCVDGQVVTKSSRELVTGEEIRLCIPPPTPTDLTGEDIQLDIVFENADVLVVNKPAGMVVHPSPGHERSTLVHAALGHAPHIAGIGGEGRPGIVHRLDKDTSGLIVIAKNDQAYYILQDQFRNRSVEKIYLALVDGAPPTPTGRVETPIGRNTSHRKLMAVVPSERGRQAVTEYRTLERFPSHTLIEVHPLTGRTHQIRVHLAFLGCPVVGDVIYGKRHASLGIGRQFLHAARLTLILPGETQPRRFEAPLPDDLLQALGQLRGSSAAGGIPL
jgi:23S rRNA pseudouridine1911/1915/1917 synthase